MDLLIRVGLISLLIGSVVSAQTPANVVLRLSGEEPLAAAETMPADPTFPDARIDSLEEQVRQLREALNNSDSRTPLSPIPETRKSPGIRLNGMLHIDGGVVAQDAENAELLRDIDNSLGFRRARIGVEGSITENVYYRFVPDFALSGRPSFRDAFVEYRDLEGIGTIRLGESRQPFGLDAQTPARDNLFLERSLAFALSPFRQTGLGLRNRTEDENVTWHAAIFGFPTDVYGNAVNDDGFGVAGRTTAILWEDESEQTLIHGGADYGYIHSGDDGLNYRSTPEYGGLLVGATPVVPFFVNTGIMRRARSNLFNAELAAIRGPLVLQGEAVTALVELETGESVAFQGAYLQALYVLTGERHGYNREFGYIERVVPRCPVSAGGAGAWELAARWSLLDLNDGSIDGGRIENLTLGLNWFLNNSTRLQFNYIHPWVDRAPVGKNEAAIYATRLAVDF